MPFADCHPTFWHLVWSNVMPKRFCQGRGKHITISETLDWLEYQNIRTTTQIWTMSGLANIPNGDWYSSPICTPCRQASRSQMTNSKQQALADRTCHKISSRFQSQTQQYPQWGLIWPWVKTYDAIFGWMNIHLPSILTFTRCQGFDPLPYRSTLFCWLQHGLVFVCMFRFRNLQNATVKCGGWAVQNFWRNFLTKKHIYRGCHVWWHRRVPVYLLATRP